MTEVTRFWWIRHAPVTAHGGRIYGQTDVDCDTGDPRCFAWLAGALPADAVWATSQLRRTHQTAAAIGAAGYALPDLLVEPDLAEQHFGDWQGQDRSEIFARNSDWRRFWLAPAHSRPPGGESFADLAARVVPVIERLGEAHGGRDVVIVAHGGTIRAALGHALALDPETAIAFTVDNVSLTQLDRIRDDTGGVAWRVVAVNRVAG